MLLRARTNRPAGPFQTAGARRNSQPTTRSGISPAIVKPEARVLASLDLHEQVLAVPAQQLGRLADPRARLIKLHFLVSCSIRTGHSGCSAPTGGAAVRNRPPAAALFCSCERGYAPGETVSDPQVFDAEQLYEELSKIWNR
jgi:hypothetical protein